ncbi:hypothetical protein CEXT_22142 [Caerostris extrusa]|uniref:Uncharacterized protein n=1 Tax=Caerostris extrusa TaxID=172846 RepID=A0AAV4UTV6_CAEEX|nr:hypothetical protein CEXT_22142 [Caerostris extrusa]
MPRYGSDSDGSRDRSWRKKTKKSRRRSSSSSSRNSCDYDERVKSCHQSGSRSKMRRKRRSRSRDHRVRSRSRSKSRREQKSYSRDHKGRSRSHSGNRKDLSKSPLRSRKHRSRSYSKDRNSRSRSRERDGSSCKTDKKKYQRRHSPAKHKHRKRDRTSHSHSREKKSRSRSRSDSHSQSSRISKVNSRSSSVSPQKVEKGSDKRGKNESEGILSGKLQAAANSDNLKKEKDVFKDNKSVSESLVELAVDDQKRVKAIEDINASSFVQQDFKSTRVWGKNKYEAPADSTQNGADTNSSDGKVHVKMDDSWKNDPEKLVHPQLLEGCQEKIEKWKETLARLRRIQVDMQ